VSSMNYTLSLHDALPIYLCEQKGSHCYSPTNQESSTSGNDRSRHGSSRNQTMKDAVISTDFSYAFADVTDDLGVVQVMNDGKHRSEEHTSELQSLAYLVC